MRHTYLFILIFAPSSLFCQITAQHDFSTGTTLGHIIEDGEIIYSHSVGTGEFPIFENTITLYNSEFVAIGSTTFESGASVAYPANISRFLFDNDDQIEYSVKTGYIGDETVKTEVRNLNGSVLFEAEDCSGFS